MPLGIIAARFSGDFPKIGFPVHRALQSLGALMGIIAFIIIVVHTSDEGKGAMPMMFVIITYSLCCSGRDLLLFCIALG